MELKYSKMNTQKMKVAYQFVKMNRIAMPNQIPIIEPVSYVLTDLFKHSLGGYFLPELCFKNFVVHIKLTDHILYLINITFGSANLVDFQNQFPHYRCRNQVDTGFHFM